MVPNNEISASASNSAQQCAKVVVDHNFPCPLLSKKMKKDNLMLFIKKKSQKCFNDTKDPFRVEAYFYWQIMELFCHRNGKALMCEVALLLLKGHHKLRKKPSTLRNAVHTKSWRIPLTQLLFSSAPDDEHREAVIKMGDDFASKGLTYPAHICYVVAKLDLGSRDQFRLIGCDSVPFGVTVLKEAIMRTETYEYMLSLTSGVAQPSFQIFKLRNTSRLPMIGCSDVALEYCETIARAIISIPNSFKPTFLQRVITLSCNLQKDLQQEKEPEWLLELQQLHRDKIADADATNNAEAEQNMSSTSSDVIPELLDLECNLETPADRFPDLSLNINQEDLFNLKYKMGHLLGQGSFGAVFAGLRKTDGKQVAIKCVNKNHSNACMRIPGDMDAMPMEVILLKRVSKPPCCSNIVNLLEWFDLPHKIIIVLEWPRPCMDLKSFADLQKGCLTEAQTRDVMLQVIRAACHCCERGVLHRDLKPSNILINPETMQVKVIDFGCGDLLKDTPFDSYFGTPTFCPPEWLIFKEYYGIPATIWGLGILLYNLLTGKYPFKMEQDMDTRQLKLIPGLSQDCWDLMLWCLEFNADLRPTFEDLFTHEWFTKGSSGQSLGPTANTSNN